MGGARVLVAGVGNVFFGDDAFGAEVVRRLLRRDLPAGVHVVDFDVRGLDLACAILDTSYDYVILVDLISRGGRPGTLYVIEPGDPPGGEAHRPGPGEAIRAMPDLHPARVLRLVAAMGGELQRVLLVGCEPAPCVDSDEVPSRLSDPVRAMVGDAADLVASLAASFAEDGSVPRRRRPPVRGRAVHGTGNSTCNYHRGRRSSGAARRAARRR